MALVTGLQPDHCFEKKVRNLRARHVRHRLDQTIPSLAVLALTMISLGIGSKPAIPPLHLPRFP
jgi:ABC-type proline/glycine betaine transport system permease subunit